MIPYIAIVDDDPEDQMFLIDALSIVGFSNDIQLFNTGEEFTSKMSSLSEGNLPYLIIMDQNMPGEDGSEVLNQLKKSLLFRYIPIIILTGTMRMKYAKELYLFGASCVLEKPSNFEKLREIAASISLLWQPISK